MLGRYHEHEYTRGSRRFIVVFSVFLSVLLAFLAFTPFTSPPTRPLLLKQPNPPRLEHTSPPTHAQHCVLTQYSIAHPQRANGRAFRRSICDNNHGTSVVEPLVCSSGKLERQEGPRRFREVKRLKALLPGVYFQPRCISIPAATYPRG